ncbi:MAG: helix-turn-helix domain-containing protein [Thermoanaerobaculia bacterium]|nr:MAG: helix-turn-helix domain-containing protein [Thermoanaerobaculia bacterium]
MKKMETDVLSTHELADALGVSESSIKRWADEGLLRVSRTAGGHRRIARAEAIRFARATRAAVVRPARLGLPEAGVAAADERSGDDAERLYRYLERGAGALARGLVFQLYLEGQTVAAIVDGPVRAALERIGMLWHERADGVFCEHRATEFCAQALHQLRLLLVPPAGAPLALGAAPAGDPYLVPSLAAAAVLASEGFDTVNLGADTPIEALEQAVESLGPRLVWVSMSAAPHSERLGRELAALARTLAPRGAHLAVGGRAAAGLRLPALPNLQVGASMAELAAFARGLASAAPARD